MTNQETICECGHDWKIHHKIDWSVGLEYGESMGCLHELTKNEVDVGIGDMCPCEKFNKEND